MRFAELNPNDVFVYESAPSSPKKRVLALPPPTNDGSAVSLGQWHGKMALPPDDQPPPPAQEPQPPPTEKKEFKGHEDLEEGTPEDIRRRYFPNAPAHDPNLAWMQGNPLPGPSLHSLPSLRFDLQGNIIPLSIATDLPTHLGLHHHAEGTTAGYTLDDVFLLSRSTVPAQRATMLGVLAHIVVNIGKAKQGVVLGLEDLVPQAEEIRKRVVAAGIEAMNERGGVGARAIEVVWASIVGWDEDIVNLEGIELQQDADVAIASLQLDFFLPQVVTALSHGDAAPETSKQLLAILHRLAQQSNKIADTITQIPKLVSSVFQNFILTPIPPKENDPLPEPAALQFLITLASASRVNAETLKEPADALLRFVTLLPPTSPFPPTLSTGLLTLTLRLYATLASYGHYSIIATTAMQPFSQLSQYVFSSTCTSTKLKVAWLNLLNAWIVCAVDPHKTTPNHDILWSQVVGCGWGEEIVQFAKGLRDTEGEWALWDAVWRAEAQWLEGAKVNSVRGGEAEIAGYVGGAKTDFHLGAGARVVHGVLSALQKVLDTGDVGKDFQHTAFCAGLLGAVIRLWLACLPPHLEGPPSSPPFDLPFPAISQVCAKLVTLSLWDSITSHDADSTTYLHARQLSGLLAAYLALSRRLPDVPQDLWVAQALAIVLRLLPGDEDVAMLVMEELVRVLTPDWVSRQPIASPTIIWENRGLSILQPFFSQTIVPAKDDRIVPLQITPRSIAVSSTFRLPPISGRRKSGLPLQRDWALTPLNHLLRSADSEVFRNLPPGWDSSEVEVARAALFLSNLGTEILTRFSLNQFAVSRAEVVFGCMRVFMLEHGQPQNDSSGEVFRDGAVEGLMNQLLEPFSYEASRKVSHRSVENQNLEQVAARYLGESTPFFQFYTDFVALYDAISFSNPTFAKLLLPPTSMRYAPDYRKHLWDDFNHILKTVRTPCDQILSCDLKEYLYPIESDPQLIGAFLRTILKETLQGFPRLIALHHIACNIWPDLRDDVTSNEARAEKLIKAVVSQGSNEAVREVVEYRQTSPGAMWVAPECFQHLIEETAEGRLKWVTNLGDEAVISRVEGLLKSLP